MKPEKSNLFILYFLFFIAVLPGSILISGCNNKNSTTTAFQLTGDTVADGKKLVQLNCTKCHALVPVDALNKNVWIHHALPRMSHFLGATPLMGSYYKSPKDTGGLSLVEWQAIVSYYNKLAPDTILPAKKTIPLINDWAGFKLKTPAATDRQVFTTMAMLNPENHKIYTSDEVSDKLTEWDSNLKGTDITTLASAGVNAIFKKNGSGVNTVMLTCIGKIEPIDFPNGKVLQVNLDLKDEKTNQNAIADILARPVQTIEGDFNKDGLTDMVILAQGNFSGGVYLFKQNTDHTYSQTNISDKPGAVRAVAGDFNHDGWQDLMILFGTGDEGLWLYLNDHKGGFTTKNLLRFPPVYGSTSFQLADMDHDGKPDLIYTCGYNFRDSRILKPYHGLYIFKNMGNWNFKQQWFYPINGCTKAIAADFDGDGDLDIATSAFFADMQNTPAESFIYFEQDKPFSFKPHAVPISKYGHWMSMDVGDVNNDGKPDIILGNYSSGFMFQHGFKPFWAKNIPFVILENHLKK
ncbi:MAG: repeat protein [Mucilaginibacter sp.]|nr:repeat protein [Mucilaginibacter sp.]